MQNSQIQSFEKQNIIGGEENIPWIILRLYSSNFAVSSDFVSGITRMPEEIVPLPGTDKAVVGGAIIRGTIVPLLDLRKFFGLPSHEQELAEFREEMEQRKQEHIHWVNELKRCAETGDEFKLTTDPHACKFGKWLDTFVTDRNELNSQIQHIKKPHSKLHSLANQILSEDIDAEEKEELLYEAENYLMTKIVRLLDETKDVFITHFTGIVLLVKLNDDDDKYLGLIADDVLSVEDISVVFEKQMLRRLYSSEYICGVAHSERTKGEIVMLDAKQLMKLCPSYDDLLSLVKDE